MFRSARSYKRSYKSAFRRITDNYRVGICLESICITQNKDNEREYVPKLRYLRNNLRFGPASEWDGNRATDWSRYDNKMGKMLHTAVDKDLSLMVEEILKHDKISLGARLNGIDFSPKRDSLFVNFIDSNLCIPIHHVKSINVANMLLTSGSELNKQDINGNTPLHTVENPAIIEMLVEAGADLFLENKRDIWIYDYGNYGHGVTPLRKSVIDGNVEKLNILLRNHYIINAPAVLEQELDKLWWIAHYQYISTEDRKYLEIKRSIQTFCGC